MKHEGIIPCEISQAEKKQLSHDFTYMWNIRNSREISRRSKGRVKGGTERGMNHKRLWTLGRKLRAAERRGMGDWDRPVMGIKEGTYFMEHWVLYANNESWNSASKTNDVLYGD